MVSTLGQVPFLEETTDSGFPSNMSTSTTQLLTSTEASSSLLTSEVEGLNWPKLIRTSQFVIEGLGILTIGSLGLFINVFALYILFKKQVMRNFHLLMCSLAVYDFFHLVLDILCFALPQFSENYRNGILLHAIPFLIPITQIMLTASCYTTVAITIERFLSIRMPFFIQKHNIKAKVFVIPVLILAIGYNIPRFFEFTVLSLCDWSSLSNSSSVNTTLSNQSYPERCDQLEEVQFYSLSITEIRKNPLYIMVYVNSMNLVVNMIIPFLTMGIMNYIIYRAMNHSHNLTRASITTFRSSSTSTLGGAHRINAHQPEQRRPTLQRRASSLLLRNFGSSRNSDQPQQNLRRSCENVLRKREARITRASIAITIMFVICHVPRCIPNVMEILRPEESPKWIPIMININHLLISVNSAFNFLFYVSYCWGKRKQGTQTTNTTIANGAEWVDELTETALNTAIAAGHNNHRILNSVVSCRRGSATVHFTVYPASIRFIYTSAGNLNSIDQASNSTASGGQYGTMLTPRVSRNSLSVSDLGQVCNTVAKKNSNPSVSESRKLSSASGLGINVNK
ncbi:G-protein coupled receptor daf-37-like isoform X2 [Tigriopus californicus]|nr:G-protein coupled receptor daf-37-like isoform X2 [Tigriopus californicus]